MARAFGDVKITWHRMKKLAEAYDRTLKEHSGRQRKFPVDSKEVDLYLSQQSSLLSNINNHTRTYDSEVKSRTFSSKSPPIQKNCRINAAAGLPSGVLCHWCNKSGHVEASCRKKSGACFRCGGRGHIARHCDYGSPQHQNDRGIEERGIESPIRGTQFDQKNLNY